MKPAARRASRILLAVSLGLAAADTARAQLVLADTERLDFDRPESWGMKYYASLALLTGMGVPERREAGRIDLGVEGGYVPQLSDAERRLGFAGTKLEDVNKTRLFGRLRGTLGVGRGVALELGYTPPIERGGATPSIVSLAVGRAMSLSPSWRLGVRGHGQLGTIKGDITCSAAEVAAGDDGQRNPFGCIRPSKDVSRHKIVGLELVVGYDGRSRFKPYAGVGLNYMDLEFRVDAAYSGGRVRDHTLQLTSGTTVSASAGLTFAASPRLRVTTELVYSSLAVARLPSTTPGNEGFVNARVFASYRIH
jgi:opacity protein-like surface antigen